MLHTLVDKRGDAGLKEAVVLGHGHPGMMHREATEVKRHRRG